MTGDILVPDTVGSTDWTGGRAPADGIHTGVSTITLQSKHAYVVAHSVGEVQTRLGLHAVAPGTIYVAFDQPGLGVPVILDVSQIVSVVAGTRPSVPLRLGPQTLLGPKTFLLGG